MQFLATNPAQTMILSTQVVETKALEMALGKGREAVEEEAKSLERRLQSLAHEILNDMPGDHRKKLEQLITEHVHQRDIVRSLIVSQVSSPNDFGWLYHMRYYSNQKDESKLQVCMADTSFLYGYEYLGMGERLVHTPLTDRCYLTLTMALKAGLGGFPFEPAGKGKNGVCQGTRISSWTICFGV